MVITTNEVEQQSVAICAACNQHIKDRYLFEVTNRKWHCICLRCTHCKCPLTEKCWFKHNNLYCKDDYYKLFFSCNNCKQIIERDTYIRKTSNMIYHLQCFQCHHCGKVLDSGDHYIVQGDDQLLCSNHYPNLQSLSKSTTKNSLTELITDQEAEIVVKTEQSNLNTSSLTSTASLIENQSIGYLSHHHSPQQHHSHFIRSLASTMDTITHNSTSPFLLNRQTSSLPPTSLIPNSISTNLTKTNNSLIHSTTTDLIPQSLSLIDYSTSHQPPSSLINNSNSLNKTNISTEFSTTDSNLDFYSTPSTACYVTSSNTQLDSLPASNLHSMNSVYEQDALRFYNSAAGCIPQTGSLSIPTPNSPLNEIENTVTTNSNGNLNNNARKGRPRKRKQIGLSSSNNTGIDAISAALHEQNLNNLNSSQSSTISQSLVNAINNSNGHLQNSNSSSSSSSNGNHQRMKRMRTSFKHSQLKMMKAYFSRNQNPDAKDLKALAHDTLLSKRVLQVWFQNARAKHRRHNSHKGDGSFNQNLQMSQTCLGSPDNGSTRQFSTPSPASIISNNSISNNHSTTIACEPNLPTVTNSITNLCSNGSSSSLDQYSPSNSILHHQTPPPSVKQMQPSSPSTHLTTSLHFGHHLSSSHNSSSLVNIPNRHLTNFTTEPLMSFQDLY